MGIDPIDASNASIPSSHPLTFQCLPLPTTTRGEPLFLEGDGGRLNDNDASKCPFLMYGTGKLIVVREIHLPTQIHQSEPYPSTFRTSTKYTSPHGSPSTNGFVYRSHSSPVSSARFSPAGTYVASADSRGKLRVWAYDHEEHLPKLEVQALNGTIRDIAWDFEGKRIVVVGDGGGGSGESGKCIQWDTAVRCGELMSHSRKRGMSCAFRPCRPMRIATGGGEDATVYFHSGPPFQRCVGEEVAEKCHERGSVNGLRYNKDGTVLCSVGTDGSVCFYQGKSMSLIKRVEKVHSSSVFGCAWNRTGQYVLTCGADGYARLLDGTSGDTIGQVVYEWNVAKMQQSNSSDKVPVGAMQLGCAFIKGDVPVSVGYNGQITVLPLPSSLNLSFTSSASSLDEPLIITGHQAPISAMTFGKPGSNTIYTADTDGIIIEWNGSTGVANGRVSLLGEEDPDLTGKVHNGAITSLVFNDFEGGTLYSSGWDDCIRITTTRLCTDQLKTESQPNAMARGGSLIVVMTVDGLLVLKDKQIVSELVRLPYTATAICLSKDDSMLYVSGDDCSIYVYSVSSTSTANPLSESHVIKGGHLKPVQSLAISHDGSMLAAADVRDVCIYSTKDYSSIVSKGRWCFHTQRIGCLAWSPDDSVLASGGNDDDIYLWCVAKKTKRIHYRFAHRGGVTQLRWWVDGDWMLVSTGNDGCLNWWNVGEDVTSKFK
ncbi:hypothetical protein ACHAW6_002190 [Cyclotella cf. meneghiniana]